MTNISDLVQWDAREYNTYADHAANVALDKGVDWKQIDEEGSRRPRPGMLVTGCPLMARSGEVDGQVAAWRCLHTIPAGVAS